VQSVADSDLDITLSVSGADAGDFSIDPGTCGATEFTLSHGESCIYSITFAPSAAGERTATLTVAASPGSEVDDASMTGTGQAGDTGPVTD
jgi:hypothetical protein